MSKLLQQIVFEKCFYLAFFKLDSSNERRRKKNRNLNWNTFFKITYLIVIRLTHLGVSHSHTHAHTHIGNLSYAKKMFQEHFKVIRL